MSLDTSEAERAAERERLSAARRAQNAMPEWHKKSTISGAMTAVGLAEEEARSAQVRPSDVVKSSSDDLLKGLGVVGAPVPTLEVPQDEDVKPAATNDSDCNICPYQVYRHRGIDVYDRLRAILCIARRLSTGHSSYGRGRGQSETERGLAGFWDFLS